MDTFSKYTLPNGKVIDLSNFPPDFLGWLKRSDSLMKQLVVFHESMVRRGNFSREILERLNNLKTQGFALEYVAIGSQMLEAGLKDLLEMYAISINYAVNEENFHEKIKQIEFKFDSNFTFRRLCEELEKYSPNKDLVTKLNVFRKIRNKVVHGIFDKMGSLEEANRLITKGIIEKNLIYELNVSLLAEGRALSEKISESNKVKLRNLETEGSKLPN